MIELSWADEAREQLADIWVAATPKEREAIEPIIVQLERDLLRDPLSLGESRTGTSRIVILSPIVVWFKVISNQVRIIRLTRPQRK